MGIKLQVKKSKRATKLRISIYPGGKVVLTRPWFVSEKKALQFATSKKAWLLKNIEKLKKVQRNQLTKKDYLRNKEKARDIVLDRVKYFNQSYGFNFNKIYIRDQKTRWGSCSSKGNLNFNWKISKLPKELVNYIVVHELCHLKELNHSKKFWQEVSKTIPNYKDLRKKLRKEGLSLL